MFEDYLEDAYALAEMASKQSNDRDKKRFYRAAAFYACSALEAFSNYIAYTLQAGELLLEHERAFLFDRKFGLKSAQFCMLKTSEYHRLEDKLRFLLAKFCPSFDIGSEPCWSHFNELKDLRDRIVHPREEDDVFTTEEYKAGIERGLQGVVGLMDNLCSGIFNKRLRKKLRDLAS